MLVMMIRMMAMKTMMTDADEHEDGHDNDGKSDEDMENLHLPGTVGWLDGQPPLLVRTNIVMIGFSLFCPNMVMISV